MIERLAVQPYVPLYYGHGFVFVPLAENVQNIAEEVSNPSDRQRRKGAFKNVALPLYLGLA